MDVYHVLGLMSGTSLDGLDMALCRFEYKGQCWHYQMIQCETVAYDSEMVSMLNAVYSASAFDLAVADERFGKFMAKCVNSMLAHAVCRPDYIASHGHTVFHRPDKGLTLQIGNGAVLAAQTAVPVICDFRTSDVAMGGQGAPLVPIGDELLFADFDACLNLGGFSNISFRREERRLAFDVSPCNMAINELACQLGLSFDKDGCIASKGEMIPELLDQLNNLSYYSQDGCKSLGREWYEHNFSPLVKAFNGSVEDKLRTVTEHIAIQLATVIRGISGKRVLVTGGGAKNKYLIQRTSELCSHELVIPDELIVDYKEALVFAFLGVLRIRGEVNCLADVTGASADHCAGAVYSV